MSRIERLTLERDTEGVGELRAGQQRAGVDIGLDLMDLHAEANLFASRLKRKTRSAA